MTFYDKMISNFNLLPMYTCKYTSRNDTKEQFYFSIEIHYSRTSYAKVVSSGKLTTHPKDSYIHITNHNWIFPQLLTPHSLIISERGQFDVRPFIDCIIQNIQKSPNFPLPENFEYENGNLNHTQVYWQKGFGYF